MSTYCLMDLCDHNVDRLELRSATPVCHIRELEAFSGRDGGGVFLVDSRIHRTKGRSFH